MRSWRIMLGPFVIWALHFVGIYALASLEAVGDPFQADRWRQIALAFSGACLIGVISVTVWLRARAPTTDLEQRLGMFGGVVAAIAVAWQSLPLLVSAVASA